MCIIAAKPAGVPMPGEDTLRAMWEGNPDGAGFMYPTSIQGKTGKGKALVQVEKGFMTYAKFKAALDALASSRDLTATPLVMHFRITTHGGTCPELTHPFPVTASHGALRKTKATAPVGVAHNGIIRSVVPSKGMSDTSEYIASQLAPLSKALPEFWKNPHALELIRNGIGSKMAILSADGTITTVGDFIEDNGLLYSNGSYIPLRWSYRSSCSGGWSDWYGYPSAWDESTPRKLMNLCEYPGAYVRLSGGHAIDTDYNDGYAIDASSRVYQYDDFLDVYIKLDGAEALTASGSPLVYSAKAATWEDTMSEDAAWELYAELEDDEATDGGGLPDTPPF